MESFTVRSIAPEDKSRWQVFQHLKPLFQISDQCLLLEYFLVSIVFNILPLSMFSLHPLLFIAFTRVQVQKPLLTQSSEVDNVDEKYWALICMCGGWCPSPLLHGCPQNCVELVGLTKGWDSCASLQPGEESEERAVEKRYDCTLNLDVLWAWEWAWVSRCILLHFSTGKYNLYFGAKFTEKLSEIFSAKMLLLWNN